jgi:hypothetical protein
MKAKWRVFLTCDTSVNTGNFDLGVLNSALAYGDVAGPDGELP